MYLNYSFKYLKNGIKVVYIPIKNVDFIKFEVVTTLGSGSEPIEKQGITHLVEHVSNNSSDLYKTTRELKEQIRQHGGLTNARTSDTSVRNYITLPSEEIEFGLDYILGIITQPYFSREIIDEQKKVIKNEIVKASNSQSRKAYYAFKQSLIDGRNGYTIDRLGTLESLSRLETGDIFDYYQKLYSADNILLFITGNFLEDDMLLIERRLEGVANYDGARIKKPQIVFRIKDSNYIYLPDSKNVSYMGAIPLVTEGDVDRAKNLFLIKFCCSFLERRLFEYMRVDNHLLYDIRTAVKSIDRDNFYLSIDFESEVEGFAAIYKEFITFFRREIEKGGTVETFEKYKKFYLRRLKISHLSEYSYSIELIDALISESVFLGVEERMKMLADCSFADIKRIMIDKFPVEGLKNFYLSDSRGIEKLQQMM